MVETYEFDLLEPQLREASEQGDEAAAAALADGYLQRGEILQRLYWEAWPPAVRLWEQPRNLRDQDLLTAVAQLSESPVAEVRMDDARHWYMEAAGWGSTRAMMALADLCDGDEREAHLQQASEHGEPRAEVLLGEECAAQGQLAQAVQWYQRAVEGGLEDAAVPLAEALLQLGHPNDAERWGPDSGQRGCRSPPDLGSESCFAIGYAPARRHS